MVLGSRPGVGAAAEGAALLCSLPRSVWVLQSLLPVFEWADSNGVEGRTGEGVEGMDSERYSVPSRTPLWKKGRKCHNPRKLTGISSALLLVLALGSGKCSVLQETVLVYLPRASFITGC